ncbi:MAG TPA: hypothetical protein VNL38_01445, partial [Candidatus Nitrosotenuis sp.]|nr:hypothetical protein [Candidatus Nitrosotenuis sp.]
MRSSLLKSVFICGKILLCVLCALCGESLFAQSGTQVTATWKTQQGLTPSAAGLKQLATIGATAVYGRVDFVAVDTGRSNQVREITCGGVTYIPQNVRGWIKADGVMIDSSGNAYVRLIPTVGCTPAGLAYEATIFFNVSSDGRLNATTTKQYKAIPDQASIDWASIAPAAAQSSNTPLQTQNAGAVLDYETWYSIASGSVPSASASSRCNIFLDSADLLLKCKKSDGSVAGLGGITSLTVREVDGAPSVAATALEFNQTYFTVIDQTGGVARVTLVPSIFDSVFVNTAGVTDADFTDGSPVANDVPVKFSLNTTPSPDQISGKIVTTDIRSVTFGNNSTFTWTFDAGAADPTLAFGNGTITVGAATLIPRAGSTAAGTAPFKFQAGALLTTPEAYALENDASNIYFTQSDGTRKTVQFGPVVDSLNTLTGALTLNKSDDNIVTLAITQPSSSEILLTLALTNPVPVTKGGLGGIFTLTADAVGDYPCITTDSTPGPIAWGNCRSPLTTLGDILYMNATPAPARLAGNTTTTPKYLRQVGTGAASAA